jgi:hypothetical protein
MIENEHTCVKENTTKEPTRWSKDLLQRLIGRELFNTLWEYFNYLSSMVTNDARFTREIKSRIAVEKAEFNKNTLFTSKLDLNLRKKLVSATFGA